MSGHFRNFSSGVKIQTPLPAPSKMKHRLKGSPEKPAKTWLKRMKAKKSTKTATGAKNDQK